jgi:hypothetical protein
MGCLLSAASLLCRAFLPGGAATRLKYAAKVASFRVVLTSMETERRGYTADWPKIVNIL